MVTSNVTERVYHLRYGKKQGTCFAIEFDKKQYLVTAKHVINELSDNDTLELNFNKTWAKVRSKLVGHHPTADVSVFSIDIILTRSILGVSSGGIMYGQDCYFLGFPYSLQDDNSSEINRQFPLPLVKKAIVSIATNGESGAYLLLDGINNPGFSGGPVIFKNSSDNAGFKIAAIISGYRTASEPTFHQGQQTPLIYKANTGIILAYTIENAIDLIRKNPIGESIPDL